MRLFIHSCQALVAVTFLAFAPAVSAGSEPTASGVWQQVDDETGEIGALVTISEHNGLYHGRITKIFPKAGDPANPICDKCSGALRNKPFIGLQIIEDLRRHGLDYDGGTIVDPEDGTVYRLEMHLSPDGRVLTVRGYLGLSAFGRSQQWRRAM